MLDIKSLIIFENDEFIIANKPCDFNFHDEGYINNGFFNTIKSQLKLSQLFPVHRLDKMTSGLIIFAKTLAVSQQFNQKFQQHDIEKYYLAISSQKPTKKQGWIKGDMVKSRRSAYKLLRSNDNPAISQFFSYSIGQGKRLFLIKPLTGKTHQIRVALKSVGSPITGDAIYNPSDNADRGYLHAFALRFELSGQSYQFALPPTTGEYFTVEKTAEQINELQQPWLLSWPKA